MEAHLDQTRPNKNRRNGKSEKTVKHSTSSFELETPRDSDGSFEREGSFNHFHSRNMDNNSRTNVFVFVFDPDVLYQMWCPKDHFRASKLSPWGNSR
jgi:hypothetical protein